MSYGGGPELILQNLSTISEHFTIFGDFFWIFGFSLVEKNRTSHLGQHTTLPCPIFVQSCSILDTIEYVFAYGNLQWYLLNTFLPKYLISDLPLSEFLHFAKNQVSGDCTSEN